MKQVNISCVKKKSRQKVNIKQEYTALQLRAVQELGNQKTKLFSVLFFFNKDPQINE